MARTNRIVATYCIAEFEKLQVCIAEFEKLQVCIDADNAYPEAIAVACANARQLMADMLADIGLAVATEPEPVVVEDE